MAEWLNNGRLTFLVGFPLIMLLMLYGSALIGVKWQGAWRGSALYGWIKRTPSLLRLIVSSLLGAITPFCSCTTIPGFAAMLEADLGLDTALVFLLASPTVDPAGVLLLLFLFGFKLTLIYVVGCLTAAVLIGWIMGRFFSKSDVNPVLLFGCAVEEGAVTWTEAAQAAKGYLNRFWWVILLSTLLGFVLYDYVPARMVAALSDSLGGLAIPLASLLGVFVYAHMAVLVPVGAALLSKGMAPGIVVAFLASSAGLSLPEILLLRKIVSLRLTVWYILATLTAITLLGFVVNWLAA